MTKWSTSVATDVMSSCWREMIYAAVYAPSRLFMTDRLAALTRARRSQRSAPVSSFLGIWVDRCWCCLEPPSRCSCDIFVDLYSRDLSFLKLVMQHVAAAVCWRNSSTYHDPASRYLLIVDLLSWPGARYIQLSKQCRRCANEMSSLRSQRVRC